MTKEYSSSSSVLYAPDAAELGAKAAERLCCSLLERSSQEYIVLGCCGGNSPAVLYEELAQQLLNNGSGILPKFHIFMVDERLVARSQIDSGEAAALLNVELVREKLAAPLIQSGLFSEQQLHEFPQTETIEIKERTADYYRRLETHGGRFDAVILGAGPDAHVAGVFPFPHITSEDEHTPRYVHYVGAPKPPPKRVTASLGLLASAEYGVLLFQGEAKEEALDQFLNSDDPKNTPACIAKRMRHYLLVTDIESESVKRLLGDAS